MPAAEPPAGAFSLRPVTRDNVEALIALTVADDQRGLVAPVVRSLAHAACSPASRPLAIYADGAEPVGLLLLWDGRRSADAPSDELYVWRLLVDARHQRRGYGGQAMRAIAEARRAGRASVGLSHVDAPGHAGPFYEARLSLHRRGGWRRARHDSRTGPGMTMPAMPSDVASLAGPWRGSFARTCGRCTPTRCSRVPASSRSTRWRTRSGFPRCSAIARGAARRVAINRYPAERTEDLRAALAAHAGMPDGCALTLGNGSDELITMLSMACDVPGAVFLAPLPGFVMYSISAQLQGIRFVGVPLTADFELDEAAMLAAIAAHRPALIYLAYPNNPTANLWDDAAIDRLIEAAPGSS